MQGKARWSTIGPDSVQADPRRSLSFEDQSWLIEERQRVMSTEQSRGVWDGSECAVLFIDYQDSVLAAVWEQDRRVVELHARTLAMAAVGFEVPVILSTVAVKMGKNSPIMPSLAAAVP